VAKLDHWWNRIMPIWHILYYGLLALGMVTTAFFGGATGPRLTTIALLAVMAGVYAAFGHTLFERPGGVRAAAYFTITWLCLYAMLIVNAGNTSAFFVLFALFPQIWAYLSPRAAVPTSVVVITGLTMTQIYVRGWGWESAARHVPEGLMQTGLVMLVGFLMVGVVNQAEQRAELIDELEATRSELAETERVRGVLAERERLAHEIHDTLAQGFVSILTLSQAIEASLERDPGQVRDRLALLERTARENLAETRALVDALAPVDLQGRSLAQALSTVAQRFSDATGVRADVQVEAGAADLPVFAEIVLLRTAQEALSNIRKHAGASQVRITLSVVGDGHGMATMTVADDGAGFDTAQVGGGFGLRGMRTRTQQAGGGFEVISAQGAGATVRVHVPVNRDETPNPRKGRMVVGPAGGRSR
jgi:signal transduction histidine kinase